MKTTLKLVFTYLGYQLLFGAVMMGINAVWPLDNATQTGWTLLLSGIAMIAHLIGFGYINLHQALRPVGLNVMLCGVLFMAGAVLCCNGLNELISLPDWLESDFTALSRTVLGVFSMALLAPLMEELLFRGAIMQSLTPEGRSPWRGIIVSAAIFGIIHVNPAQVFFAFLMGLAFAWLTWQTQSLLPAIVGHVLNNSLGVVEIMAEDHGILLPEEYPTPTLLAMIVAGLVLALLMAILLVRLVPAKEEKTITT